MPNAIAEKIAASSNADPPIPNKPTPANDSATNTDVMAATITAAQTPPIIAFDAPLRSDTSSQYQLVLLMANALLSSDPVEWFSLISDQSCGGTCLPSLLRRGNLQTGTVSAVSRAKTVPKGSSRNLFLFNKLGETHAARAVSPQGPECE